VSSWSNVPAAPLPLSIRQRFPGCTGFEFVAWVIWFWLLIRCFADIFCPARPRAGAKVLWMIFLIVLPFSACSSI
jgi:hypothetical protein